MQEKTNQWDIKRQIRYQEELDKLNLEPDMVFYLTIMYGIIQAIELDLEPYKIYEKIIKKIDGESTK